MKKDIEILNELIKHFNDLKTAWEEIERTATTSTPQVSLPKFGGGLSISG
jgi:flagellin-specific chaperone FliS